MQSRRLLTGGSGLLGQYLQKYIECYAPSHDELDITNPKTLKGDFDLIISCAAYTDVPRAEKEARKCLDINVSGTINLLNAYPNTPIAYISSEYAKNPVNMYAYSKKLSEDIIMLSKRPFLIIRTLFKPVPFPFKKAFVDQWTQGDEITVIAPMIAKAIAAWKDIWNMRTSELIYAGTGRKRIIDIARKSNPNVKECSVDDIKDVVLPKDYI